MSLPLFSGFLLTPDQSPINWTRSTIHNMAFWETEFAALWVFSSILCELPLMPQYTIDKYKGESDLKLCTDT